MVSVVGTLPLFPARITMTGWRVGRAVEAMMMSLGPSYIPFLRSVFALGGGTLYPFFLPPAGIQHKPIGVSFPNAVPSLHHDAFLERLPVP